MSPHLKVLSSEESNSSSKNLRQGTYSKHFPSPQSMIKFLTSVVKVLTHLAADFLQPHLLPGLGSPVCSAPASGAFLPSLASQTHFCLGCLPLLLLLPCLFPQDFTWFTPSHNPCLTSNISQNGLSRRPYQNSSPFPSAPLFPLPALIGFSVLILA